MEPCSLLLPWLKRLAACSMVGMGVLFLGAVVFKMAVAAAVFALVGCLLWLPLHTVFRGPRSSWRSARRQCSECHRQFQVRARQLGEVVGSWGPRVLGVLVETFCGAAIAMILVLLAGMDGPAVAIAGAVGMVAGAVLGAMRR